MIKITKKIPGPGSKFVSPQNLLHFVFMSSSFDNLTQIHASRRAFWVMLLTQTNKQTR